MNTNIEFFNQCPKCLRPYWDEGKSTGLTPICECNKTEGILGWICPICNKGVSPYATSCPCSFNIYYNVSISNEVISYR